MISWIAIYKDGTVLSQHTSDGRKISSDLIDRNLVEKFHLIDLELDKIIFTLHIENNQKLIYRRRTEISVGNNEKVCHLVGWRNSVAQSICYVFEDGKIEVASSFNENHPWFYSPVLRDFEK